MLKALLTFTLLTGFLLASVEKSAEQYARSLFEKHPELLGNEELERAISDFKETLEEEADNFFFVDGEEKNKLKKKRNCIDEHSFSNTYAKFAQLENIDREGKFILIYIRNNPPSDYDQLFLYRYIKHITPNYQIDSANGGKSKMEEIFQVYLDKKNELERIPSFKELELPSDLAFFISSEGQAMNWIYIADAEEFIDKDPRPVIAHPIARSSGRVDCIRENGKMSAVFHHSTLSEANTNRSDLSQAKIELIDPAYLKELSDSASVIIKRHQLYLDTDLYHKATNNSIDQLRFENGETAYPHPKGVNTSEWIYLGATHKTVAFDKRIICVTSTAVKGEFYLGFFADGTSLNISQEQFNIIKEKGL